jgi:hypothetical protein
VFERNETKDVPVRNASIDVSARIATNDMSVKKPSERKMC